MLSMTPRASFRIHPNGEACLVYRLDTAAFKWTLTNVFTSVFHANQRLASVCDRLATIL